MVLQNAVLHSREVLSDISPSQHRVQRQFSGVIYEKQEVSVLLTFSADMRKAQALNSVKSESQSF